MTIILFAVIAAMNIWCSFLLIEVMDYTKKHVFSFLRCYYRNQSIWIKRLIMTIPILCIEYCIHGCQSLGFWSYR